MRRGEADYQFQSSSSSCSSAACAGGGAGEEGRTLGIRTAPRPCSLPKSGSSSRRDAELDEGTVESGDGLPSAGKVEDCLGEGEARAAKMDCETSESRSDARFCDFVNLENTSSQTCEGEGGKNERVSVRVASLQLLPFLANTVPHAAHPSCVRRHGS